MKKILYILLVAIIVLSLTGCTISKERMLEKSKKIYVDELREELEVNFKKAKKKYKGNIYEIDAGVISIEEDFAKIALGDYGFYDKEYLEVHFKDKDLEKLKVGERITFVGKISDISKEDNYIKVKIKKAHYISNIMKITGYFKKSYEEHCFSTLGGICSYATVCSFHDKKNEYISYEYNYGHDDCDILYDLDIDEYEEVNVEAKMEVSYYRDDNNFMIFHDEWDIDIISIENRKIT